VFSLSFLLLDVTAPRDEAAEEEGVLSSWNIHPQREGEGGYHHRQQERDDGADQVEIQGAGGST